MFDVIAYIGRFSPIHTGHVHVCMQALQQSNYLVILVGSSDESASARNPWSFEYRRMLIETALDEANIPRTKYSIRKLLNSTYNDQKWEADVQSIVAEECVIHVDHSAVPKIGLIGHSKDESSYYLKSFPQWNMIEVEHIDGINATNIRDVFFNSNLTDEYKTLPGMVKSIVPILETFKGTLPYDYIAEEYDFLRQHTAMWADAPYPPTFNTVDAVVIQSGHILLIQRKEAPGRALFALPGGYVGINESLETSMIRELREETCIKVPEKVLRGCIRKRHTYDDPNRSSRGRVITHVFYIRLNDVGELPHIRGADDAVKAEWFPLSVFLERRGMMFEDHYHIVRKMLGL